MPEFGKIVVFGTGLIGGSFALALKEAEAVEEVVGFGRTPSTLRVAQELGVIDRAGINPTHEIEDADIVLVATPVAQMPEIFERIAPYLGPNTIVTDGGSTKGDVVAAARAAFGERIGQFVPAHPIAGAENSGPAAARWDLYRGRKVVVTPLPENADDALDHIKRAWSLCGADIYELTPEAHDRVFAAVSHLPHLLSFALVARSGRARGCRPVLHLRRFRIPRFHPHRRQPSRNVARHLPRQSRCPVAGTGQLPRATRRSPPGPGAQ